MNRIYYLIQKEFRQILREKAYLGIIFVMPFIQLVILGFAITTDIQNVPFAVVDQDHSAVSRRIAEAFSANQSFSFSGELSSADEARRAMDANHIRLALIIPDGFMRDLKSGRSPQLQALVDGVDGNTAGIVLGYAVQISARLQQEFLKNQMIAVEPGQSLPAITSIETRMWYNESLQSRNNIVPGIIAVLLTMITAFLTAMNIVREKEIGTLEQIMVTPLRKHELIIGKIMPFVVIGLALETVGILAAGLIFGLWMKGSLLTLYGMSLLYSLTTLGLGIFASTIARTQQQAMFIAWFFSIYAILLSGFFIPIENMPHWIQVLTYLNPLRFFMVVIREIYLKGTTAVYLWKEALLMLVYGSAMITMATLGFQKRLS